MPLTRQQLALALARARRQRSKAKSHKARQSSNLRSMSASKEPASAMPDVNPKNDLAVLEHLKSWLTGVASIDELIPLPTDLVIAKPAKEPDPDEKPKSEDQGKNRALKASTVRQLNIRLRKYGLVMKRIVSPEIDRILGVQSTSESTQSSEKLAEYEIVGMNGESKNWMLDTLGAAAEDDKADRTFQEQAEKEKAESEDAVDDEDQDLS